MYKAARFYSASFAWEAAFLFEILPSHAAFAVALPNTQHAPKALSKDEGYLMLSPASFSPDLFAEPRARCFEDNLPPVPAPT